MLVFIKNIVCAFRVFYPVLRVLLLIRKIIFHQGSLCCFFFGFQFGSISPRSINKAKSPSLTFVITTDSIIWQHLQNEQQWITEADHVENITYLSWVLITTRDHIIHMAMKILTRTSQKPLKILVFFFIPSFLL